MSCCFPHPAEPCPGPPALRAESRSASLRLLQNPTSGLSPSPVRSGSNMDVKNALPSSLLPHGATPEPPPLYGLVRAPQGTGDLLPVSAHCWPRYHPTGLSTGHIILVFLAIQQLHSPLRTKTRSLIRPRGQTSPEGCHTSPLAQNSRLTGFFTSLKPPHQANSGPAPALRPLPARLVLVWLSTLDIHSSERDREREDP